MRTRRFLLLLLLSLPVAAVSQTPPAQPAAAPAPRLQLFTIPDGHASILMPGAPVFESQNVSLQGGVNMPLNEYYVELENKNLSYMLMYNDYPPNYANDAPDAMLVKFRDGAVKGKTLLTDAPITLGNIPGRAFTAKDTDGWLYEVRHYFVNKRLYQLIIVTGPGHTASFHDEFLNSFQIK